MQQTLAETERNRAIARQIELADEASFHRVRDQQMAQMTAFHGDLIEELAARPKALPAAMAPQMISNVTNIQNVTPTSYITNLQNNIYQSTHHLHHSKLQFINATSNRVINLGGSLAEAFNNSVPDPQPPQIVVNGGPPPPPPAPGGARVAIQDRAYGPSNVPAIRDRQTPYPKKEATSPLALKDVQPVIKKPKIIMPPRRPVPMIIDAPIRAKPRKNKAILEILDQLEDAQPKRAKKATPAPSTQLALAPPRNWLRVVPA